MMMITMIYSLNYVVNGSGASLYVKAHAIKSIFIKEIVSGTDVIPSRVKMNFMFFGISINNFVKGPVVNPSNCMNIRECCLNFP
jgi:hypothetical protein